MAITNRQRTVATLVGDRVRVECSYDVSSFVKLIPGADWVYAERAWFCPATLTTLEMLRGLKGAEIDGAISERIGADIDGAPDPIPEDLDGVIAQMPVKVRPYSHQAAAFKRCMEVFG